MLGYILILLAIISVYTVPVFLYYKFRIFRKIVPESDGIRLYKWPKKVEILPYSEIEHVSLRGTIPNYPGYTASLEISSKTKFGQRKSLTVPVSAKCTGGVVLGLKLGYQVGIDKEALEKIIQIVPEDKIDPNLVEFVEKGEINLAKISNAWGASSFKLRLL